MAPLHTQILLILRHLKNTSNGEISSFWNDGKELFYRTPDSKIMVVNYTASGESFQADKPRLWSPGQFTTRGTIQNYALHPDGKRFAVLRAHNATEVAPIDKASFTFNFFEELRHKAPAGKNRPRRGR